MEKYSHCEQVEYDAKNKNTLWSALSEYLGKCTLTGHVDSFFKNATCSSPSARLVRVFVLSSGTAASLQDIFHHNRRVSLMAQGGTGFLDAARASSYSIMSRWCLHVYLLSFKQTGLKDKAGRAYLKQLSVCPWDSCSIQTTGDSNKGPRLNLTQATLTTNSASNNLVISYLLDTHQSVQLKWGVL